jgi:hypothetical protein
LFSYEHAYQRYMKKGYGYLFDEQVISYSTVHREHANTLVVEATRRAIRLAHGQSTPIVAPVSAPDEAPAPVAGKALAAVEAAPGVHADKKVASVDVFKRALLSKHGSAEKAFKSVSKNGLVSKTEWKRALLRLMPELTGFEMKSVRKQLPKNLKSEAFIAFVGRAVDVVGSEAPGSEAPSVTGQALADLPSEVPEIPSSFMQRPHAQQQLLLALVDGNSSRSAAVTAPKSKVASQGST